MDSKCGEDKMEKNWRRVVILARTGVGNDCNLEKHVSFRSFRYATARGGGGESFRENQKLGTQLFRLALLFVFPFRPSVTELPS